MNLARTKCHLSNRGFTLLELLAGIVLLGIGAYASTSVFSYVSSRYQSMGTTKSLQSVIDGTSTILSDSIKQYWLTLAKNGCAGASTTFTGAISGFSTTPYSVYFLDNSSSSKNPNNSAFNLQTLLPPIVNTQPYTAIKNLITSNANTAASQCSTLGSLANQLMCRCAAAITPYGTLQTAEATSVTSARSGFYGCVVITATPNAGLNSQIATLLQGGHLLVEFNYSITNAGMTSPLTCSQIGTGGSMPSAAQGTFAYNYLWYTAAPTNLSPYVEQDGVLVRP